MKILYTEVEEILNLSNDLQIELSLIDSGLIISEINGTVIFFIKDSTDMVEGLKKMNYCSITFTPVERPEFPTINTGLKLKTEKGLSVKYDYFFNADSEYDLNLLDTIRNQNEVNLYFYTEMIEKCVKLAMEETESSQLKNSLDKIKI